MSVEIRMEQETVYGSSDDSHIVMSEKVQSLAGSIYQEFEKMISKYDEDVVKDLMPLVVNVLECLDLSYTENQEHEVELELLREDNEQLVTQYEREKQLRKTTEQKLLEIEDAIEDERKDLFEKIDSLESIVKMLELKSKNSSDHVYRLEEREQEMKKEYTKLHERYTELFKAHMDCMERTKLLMGSGDRMDIPGRNRMTSMGHMSRSSGPVSFGFSSLEGGSNFKSIGSPAECPPIPASPPDSAHSNTSLKNELNIQEPMDDEPSSVREISERGWSETLASVVSKDDSSPDQDISEDIPPLPAMASATPGKSQTKREQRSGNTLYQELSFQDAEALGEMDEGADITGSWVHPGDYASSVNDNFFGMGKEVENLIMENHELLATKNALNVVKDDLIVKVDELTGEQEMMRNEIKSLQALRTNLRHRIEELEDELKRSKEENEKLTKANKSDDEEDVPMAQRKRFTRIEMARVLMERNQYKERYMELQEAVRWSEMIRASRNDAGLDKKNKQSVWKFFSSLFSGSTDERAPNSGINSSRRGMPLGGYVHYNAPTHHVSPALESMRKRNLAERRRGLNLIDSNDVSGDKSTSNRRMLEKKEQFRQVRAHVSKDDGRLRAYGWSLPSRSTILNPPPCSASHVPVPVPIYCRPLMECEPGMKVNTSLWCATGVNLSGGLTRDGGMIVGASVFYPSKTEENKGEVSVTMEEKEEVQHPEIEKLQKELKEGEQLVLENEVPDLQKLSSLVWICTSTKSVNTLSTVNIVDANNPADIIGSFTVCQAHVLCIASVPGAKESDYEDMDEEESKEERDIEEITVINGEYKQEENEKDDGDDKDTAIGKITFVSCAVGSDKPPEEPQQHSEDDESSKQAEISSVVAERVVESELQTVENIVPQRRLIKEIKEGLLKDGLTVLSTENTVANEEVKKMSSVLPTIWLGSQNGYVFVHSAVAHWSKCLHSVKLREPVLSIVHVVGRVVCALADGTIAIFKRGHDGQWDLSKYYSVRLGRKQYSVRCLAAVHSKVWCGYKNKIHVFDPKTLVVQATIEAHPRRESQVRQMAWLGDGVWVSIRLDSTLRLYHAHTYQHLQDVDIEPYVSKMLGTGKLGFSFVRITALLISSHRLWIGTGNGVIISVPLSEHAGSSSCTVTGRTPGGAIRVFSNPNTLQVTPGSFIPYCSMAQAQLSFHGHRDAVKFFVAVPGNGSISAATTIHRDNPIVENVTDNETLPSMLVMSGGEGYIDFRTGEVEDDASAEGDTDNGGYFEKSDPCYLIVWQGDTIRLQ